MRYFHFQVLILISLFSIIFIFINILIFHRFSEANILRTQSFENFDFLTSRDQLHGTDMFTILN